MQLTEDVQDECADFGSVEGLIIPQPPKNLPPTEPGRAYIKFANHEDAVKAKPVFDGRLFDGAKITAKLVPDEDFQKSSDGEWIHIPLPGGLPAHPGLLPTFRTIRLSAAVDTCTLQVFSRRVCCNRSTRLLSNLSDMLLCIIQSASAV